MSTLGWIAVPGGRNETSQVAALAGPVAVLRVLVVPRLDVPLAGSPMQDWPATVADVAPVVTVRRAGQVDTTVAATPRRLASSECWAGFFGHGIGVVPWQPHGGYGEVNVVPTLHTHDAVRASYQAAADQPGDTGVVRDQLAGWTAPAASPRPLPTDPQFAEVDVHRAVSLLREHPYVLRMLGLVLDLELDAAALPSSAGGAHPQVQVTWPQSPVPIESPWTAYSYDGLRFLPAPGGDVADGLVDVSDESRWVVITLDVDGADGKLREAARAAAGNGGADLPGLRTAGLQLARRGRGEQLNGRAARGRANATGSLVDAVLTADDLVLGYRLDVRPQRSNTWFSLHARTAQYTVDGHPVGPEAVVVEEGHLKPHAAVRDDSGLRADDIVARWSGWSLAAPRPMFPGRAVNEGRTPAADRIPYRFTAGFEAAPNSLPELVFGVAYQLRVRVVDLAGGGLELDDPEAAAHPTGLVPYTRYEPVPPPDVVLPDGLLVPDPDHPDRMRVDPARLGPGGTLERLVVRSTPATDGTADTTEFAGAAGYPANDSRTVHAPATTFGLAEQHGAFSTDAATGWTRAVRSSPIDPTTVLPDPVSLGAAATLVPEPGGVTSAITDTRPWAGAWPDLEPKTVQLVAADPDEPTSLHWVASGAAVAPEADAQSTTVSIALPPGQHAILEVSSTILQDHLDSFAIKQLASTPDADTAAIEGRHPLLTPARRLEVVHAVRRPVLAPAGTVTTSRPVGSTFTVLEPHDAVFGVDPSSTAQVALTAAWPEWGDGPDPVTATAGVPPVLVARGATTLPEIRQEFGDTRHRTVTYTVTASTRYREFFAAADPDELFRVSTTLDPVSVRSSARPPAPVVVSTVPAFAWAADVAGGGSLVRTRSGGRLRLELGRPWFVTGEGECLAVVIWPGTEDDLPAELRSMVSWVNRDPIHPTPTPAALATEAMFAGVVGAADVTLPESGHRVRVLPHPVFHDDGRWCADVEIPGAATVSYAPFVHLAVARYQTESFEGLSLSTIVGTDMVPVLPDRRLELTQDGAGVRVTFTGISREGTRPNRVVATLEQFTGAEGTDGPVSVGPAAPEFATWRRVPEATVSGPTNSALPVLPVPAGGRLRLVVREVEDLTGAPEAVVDAVRELTERTVFVDEVVLPLA